MPRTLNADTLALIACFYPGEDDRGDLIDLATADDALISAAQLVAEYFTLKTDDGTVTISDNSPMIEEAA